MIDDDAREYVELLSSKPNGWGQHVHPRYGQSHGMLHVMQRTHGKLEFAQALQRVAGWPIPADLV